MQTCTTINKATFFDKVRPMFAGKLTAGQVQGMEAIIQEYAKRRLTDVRWLAYVLATTFHETARTMAPIEEYGKGKGKPYGKKLKLSGKAYTTPDKIYYGRGLAQVTWYENYDALTRAAKLAGYNWDFLNQPELLLQMEPSVWSAFHGMITGMFTGKRLSQYFNEDDQDWINARAIINSTDKAELIAEYAKKFYKALA